MPPARLPFKRLNPEPKENQPPKRTCAHACPEPSDQENDNEASPLPLRSGPPLVNGRGPLDGFLSRRCPGASDENMVIDLTEDNTSSPLKHLVSPASASSCHPAKDTLQDKSASSEKSSNADCTPKKHTLDCLVVGNDIEEDVEEKDLNQTTSLSQLDTTQDSDSDEEDQNESGNVSSLGNKSMQSVSSSSSLSESSPEKSKSEDPTPNTTPRVCTPQDHVSVTYKCIKLRK